MDSIIRRSSGVIAVGRGRWGEALPWSGGGVVDFGGVGEVGGGRDDTSGGDVNDVEVVRRCGKKGQWLWMVWNRRCGQWLRNVDRKTHVEELEHEVEDNEVVVVSPLAGEGPVLAKCQSEVVVQLLSARPCQNHWAAEVKSSMSSEAKSVGEGSEESW